VRVHTIIWDRIFIRWASTKESLTKNLNQESPRLRIYIVSLSKPDTSRDIFEISDYELG
jgi:hypothetical protein